jgi:hypothetical protein
MMLLTCNICGPGLVDGTCTSSFISPENRGIPVHLRLVFYHLKARLNTFQMSTNVMEFQQSHQITNIFCIVILVTKLDLRP